MLKPSVLIRSFVWLLNLRLCGYRLAVDASDSKGEPIHQTLMAKKMQRLDESPDFRPFKFRIAAFTNAFLEEVRIILSKVSPTSLMFYFPARQTRISRRKDSHEKGAVLSAYTLSITNIKARSGITFGGRSIFNASTRMERRPNRKAITSGILMPKKGVTEDGYFDRFIADWLGLHRVSHMSVSNGPGPPGFGIHKQLHRIFPFIIVRLCFHTGFLGMMMYYLVPLHQTLRAATSPQKLGCVCETSSECIS